MLELLDLHRSYGEVRALDGLTLRAEPGRLLGFLGPNGAGKTTAMRATFGHMPEKRGLYPRMRCREQVSYLGHLRGMPAAGAVEATDAWLGELDLVEAGIAPFSPDSEQASYSARMASLYPGENERRTAPGLSGRPVPSLATPSSTCQVSAL